MSSHDECRQGRGCYLLILVRPPYSQLRIGLTSKNPHPPALQAVIVRMSSASTSWRRQLVRPITLMHLPLASLHERRTEADRNPPPVPVDRRPDPRSDPIW